MLFLNWHLPLTFGSLVEASPELHPYIPDYQYWLCDLSQYSDEKIVGAIKLQVALLLLN